MHIMLQLLIATAVMSLALCKSEEVKAILYEYNDTPILRLKQQFILRGYVMVQTESHNDLYNYLKIKYRKKGDTDFHMFDTLDFKQCMASKRFYCVQDKNTFLTYLNTTTAVEFNQSEWKMFGSYNGYEFSSNALILPIVQPNVETSLFINLNQSYSKCEQGILENKEIVLEGHVLFYGNFEEDEMYITIEKKLTNSTNFDIYKTVSLNHCETSSDFKCTRDGDLYSYTTTLSFNATKEQSESLWRLAGEFKGTPYYSTPVQLPRILDSSKVLMRLNGQTLSKSNTSFTIKGDEELILCCITTLSPCLAVITVNHNQSFLNQSCVSHRPIKGDKSTYMFGYIVCGDDKYSQVFPIDVNILQVKDSTYEERVVIILGAVFGAIGLIVLIFSLIYCWRKSKNKKTPQKFSGQSSDCLLDMPEERKERNSIVLEAEVIKKPHSSRQNTQNKETKGIKESTKKSYLPSRHNTKSMHTKEIKGNRNKMETPLVYRITRSKQKELDEKNAKRTKSTSPRRRIITKPKKFSEDNDAEMLTPKMQSKNTKLEERKLSYSVKHTRNKQILLKNPIPERSKLLEFDEENAKMMDSYQSDEKINLLQNLRIRRSQTVQL